MVEQVVVILHSMMILIQSVQRKQRQQRQQRSSIVCDNSYMMGGWVQRAIDLQTWATVAWVDKYVQAIW
jgi:preprotein translocase subunit YajC